MIQSFEKGRKELSNGRKWVLRLISPIVKPVCHPLSKFRGHVLICRLIRMRKRLKYQMIGVGGDSGGEFDLADFVEL